MPLRSPPSRQALSPLRFYSSLFSKLLKTKPHHVTPLLGTLQWLPVSVQNPKSLSPRSTRPYLISPIPCPFRASLFLISYQLPPNSALATLGSHLKVFPLSFPLPRSLHCVLPDLILISAFMPADQKGLPLTTARTLPLLCFIFLASTLQHLPFCIFTCISSFLRI